MSCSFLGALSVIAGYFQGKAACQGLSFCLCTVLWYFYGTNLLEEGRDGGEGLDGSVDSEARNH